MSVYSKRVGLRNVGSYQVSGTPWITGSANLDDGKVHMIEFPYVSKSFTVINNNTTTGYDIRVHFHSGSSTTALTVPGEGGAQTIAAGCDVIAGNHFITVPSGYASVTFDAKCAKFYISQATSNDNLSYQVFAELTQIPTGSMYHLTGSGISDKG
tara:strand:+ start:667 stop:1131 length:465 start_codon:yes stop_codon:yes gene_type:complete